MTEAKKVGSKYQVYDHVLNLTRKFKNKADADEFADSLNPKPVQEIELDQTTNEKNQSNV